MEKQKKSFGTIALVVLLLIVTVVSLILATYAWAKYTTTAPQQTATAEVAKWNVSFNNGGTFTQSYSHVSSGKIAPGTSGTLTVQPVPGTTETCFDYKIHIDSVRLLNGSNALADNVELADGVTVSEVLGHISFTCGSVDLKNTDIVGSYDLANNTNPAGTHNSSTGAINNKSTGADFANDTYTFTWNWPYSTTGDAAAVAAYDLIDTAAGKYAAQTGNDLKLEIKYTCTATQTNPSYTAGHIAND